MKRAIIETEVNIDRSPANVFDYCSDHRHEPEWNPKMKRIERSRSALSASAPDTRPSLSRAHP